MHSSVPDTYVGLLLLSLGGSYKTLEREGMLQQIHSSSKDSDGLGFD